MYSHPGDKNLSADRIAADILSSMANGSDETSPVIQMSSVESLTCGITRTTPTLTPTTLRNIEESFMEIHSSIPAQLEHQHQAGFAPPIVSFIGVTPKQEEWADDCMQSSDRSVDSPRPPSEASVGSRVSRAGRNGGRRPQSNEKLSPEEEERRRIRRERNKLAAARCRKRRMELTSNLTNETDGLEKRRHNLQQEIQLLTCQKEELEFILEAHKATCKLQSKPKSRIKSAYHRPSTLPLSTSNYNGNVPKSSPSLNTPSAGLYQFESAVEGQSFGMSCGGQQRSSSSDLSSPDSMTPPKLVSL